MAILKNIDPLLLQQITTIATVVIAVFAFFISFWQVIVQRRHNRLSVKPLLTFEELKAKTERGHGVFLRNDGVGPAIIKKFQIFVDNVEIISDYNSMWHEAANKLGVNYKFILFHICQPGTAISPGTRFPLFTIEQSINNEQDDLFRKAITRLNIEIIYESIYKQRNISKLNE